MKQAQRRRLLKREARHILKAHYRSSVSTSLFLLLCLSGCRAIGDSITEMLGEYFSADRLFSFRLLFELATVLLTAPLFCGILAGFYDRMFKNDTKVDLFFFYRSFSFYRSACLCGLVGCCALRTLDILTFSEELWGRSIPDLCESATDGLLRIGFGAGELLLFCAALCTCLLLPLLVFKLRRSTNGSFGKSLYDTLQTMRGAYGELFWLIASFFPLFVLSYMSFDLIAILYALPYFLYTLCAFAAYAECVRFTLSCVNAPLYTTVDTAALPSIAFPKTQ